MGIDKDKVDLSRRSQTHTVEDAKEAPTGAKASQPPYLFKSGDTLLAMTKKHNVSLVLLVAIKFVHVPPDDYCAIGL